MHVVSKVAEPEEVMEAGSAAFIRYPKHAEMLLSIKKPSEQGLEV